MKTIRIISATIIAIILGLNTTSCSSSDEPTASATNDKVQDAIVSYTYNIPAELLDYVMIDAVYNDYAANDVVTEPVLGSTYKMTYRIDKFPTKTPLVFVYTRTNRPLDTVTGQITMTTTVTMNVGGRQVTTSNTSIIPVDDINSLVTNVHNRTYGTQISKNGQVSYIIPENYR